MAFVYEPENKRVIDYDRGIVMTRIEHYSPLSSGPQGLDSCGHAIYYKSWKMEFSDGRMFRFLSQFEDWSDDNGRVNIRWTIRTLETPDELKKDIKKLKPLMQEALDAYGSEHKDLIVYRQEFAIHPNVTIFD